MEIKADFHVHTNLCDGKDSPEEIILAALQKGFSVLGFSGHGYTDFDSGYTMSREGERKYRRIIPELKEKYRGKIDILCGIEQDFYSGAPDFKYDYIIGSVHYVKKNGRLFSVDGSPEKMSEAVAAYGGDFDFLSEDYFENVGRIVKTLSADIIGHFDIVSKYSEKNGYCQSRRYLSAAERAVKRLVPYDRPFEINTGAISRGVKSIPYPSREILKIIRANGGKIIFSSDCHDKNNLGFGFSAAAALAKECGFYECLILTSNGFKTQKL